MKRSTGIRTALGLSGAALTLLGASQRGRALAGPLIGVGSGLFVTSLFRTPKLRAVLPHEVEVEAEHVVSILRPQSELFSVWRSVENCASWMKLVDNVRETGPRTSHWDIIGPAGIHFAYDAEITEEVAGEKIVWESTVDSPIAVHGWASFKSRGRRGTEVRVRIRYRVPIGLVGALAALLGHEPTVMLKEDLRRFKQLTETGEIARNDGPRAGRHGGSEPGSIVKKTIDAVTTLKNTHGATATGSAR